MTTERRKLSPIWRDDATGNVKIIDQRLLPHELVLVDLSTVDDAVKAIKEMYVRGAPLIGVTAAYGLYLAARACPAGRVDDGHLREAADLLTDARPTAVNLAWAVARVLAAALAAPQDARLEVARRAADALREEELENCRRIGEAGVPLIRELHGKKRDGQPVNILTHCNAGWLACVDFGTATAPIYLAAEAGIDVHVWVDETRPLNQGSRLTAWELGQRGIRHTIITDNAGGHLMQHGLVDMVIVGTDRTSCTGDVANKIGTYLKALAARDNGVPFYVALPSSTFDWHIRDGVKEIPIEEREPDEVRYVQGLAGNRLERVLVPPAESPAANYAFDVTPSRLVTGFITERGVCGATEAEIRRLFPDKFKPA